MWWNLYLFPSKSKDPYVLPPISRNTKWLMVNDYWMIFNIANKSHTYILNPCSIKCLLSLLLHLSKCYYAFGIKGISSKNILLHTCKTQSLLLTVLLSILRLLSNYINSLQACSYWQSLPSSKIASCQGWAGRWNRPK